MALKPCPNCRKKISLEASACPHCGQPLNKEVWATSQKSNAIGGVISIIGTIALLAYCFHGGGTESPADKTARYEKECKDPISAFVYSHQAIEKSLKAPSTADFAGYTDSRTKVFPLGECRHLILSYVDAQNSFGAKIRTYYTNVIEYRQNTDSWYSFNASVTATQNYTEAQAAAYLLYSQYKIEEKKLPASSSTPASSASSQNNIVRDIQVLLKAKGYDIGTVDGIYGKRTRAAIITYQRDNELSQTGEATQDLLERLRQ